MLTRVFKKSFVQGWTLNDDGMFNFNYTAPPKFADDAKISDWAKPSVYFMASHGIISGVGNNNFAPKATTSAEQAANYAGAIREQALAISVRMTENLDKTDAKEILPPTLQPEAKSSSNFGKTWTTGNTPESSSRYYELGADSEGSYLLMGLEGTTLLLDTASNTVKYYSE